jgi:hypothetical protein
MFAILDFEFVSYFDIGVSDFLIIEYYRRLIIGISRFTATSPGALYSPDHPCSSRKP